MAKVLVYVANRFWLILTIYISSILISAGLFSHFESRSYIDALWWSFVTALTIGYGDLSPVSVSGRITGVIFGHFWVFGIVPLIISNIIYCLLEDRNKFTHEEQEWQERMLKAIAVKLCVEFSEAPPDY